MTTMVDSKIGRTFQRSVGRAKEKLLQNLGKVDRTADEILDEQIGNFTKQQGAATRLQKELNNYIRCIRACAAASRSLLEAVGEVYEPEWGGKEMLTVNAQSVELLWNDFAHRLAEQVLIPLNTYQGQFPEMRKKIEKRSRKLIDFDGERHALQALQANPRRAEAKLAKQRESLEAAKRTYDVLNSELHDELPSLYNSRIVFLVSAMSTLFASENIFHNETSKVFTELEGVVERLSKESAKGNLNFKVPTNAIMNHSADSGKEEMAGHSSAGSNNSSKASSPASPSRPTSLNMNMTPSKITIMNGEEHSLTTNNKMGDANNHITSNGNGASTPESPKDMTHQTPNGVPNGDHPKVEEVKVPNGTSNGEVSGTVTEVVEQAEPKEIEKGNDMEKEKENVDVKNALEKNANDIETTDALTVKSEIIDANNNDVSTPESASMIKKAGIDQDRDNSDKGKILPNGSDKIVAVDDDEKPKKEDNKSADQPEEAPIATSRGVNKTLHGILSDKKHANGELSEESPAKDKNPGSGDSKEPGVLYRVRATYRYQKEDMDELSFEAGEIIRVIEYDEPEEQEEGWLMGIKENGEKGLFPANFTRPV